MPNCGSLGVHSLAFMTWQVYHSLGAAVTSKLQPRVCEEGGRHGEAASAHFHPYLVHTLYTSCLWVMVSLCETVLKEVCVPMLISLPTQVSPLRSGITQWVKEFVPNHMNNDGVSGLLNSQWFLHSPSDVYTSDMVQAVHLTSQYCDFLICPTKESNKWSSSDRLDNSAIKYTLHTSFLQDCKFLKVRDCTFHNLESLLLLCI